MKRSHIILARILLAVPLFLLFLVFGEQAPEMLSILARVFKNHPLL